MADHAQELVAKFCNATTIPLHTLPNEFCGCGCLLNEPGFIVALVILILGAMAGCVFLTWTHFLWHMAENFIKMSESERMEYMFKIVGQYHLEQELELAEAARRGGAPSQSVGKHSDGSSSSSMTLH